MEIRTLAELKSFLREARLQRGLTTWQSAADATGVPLQSVRRAEAGPEDPRFGTVLKLLAGYGLTMDVHTPRAPNPTYIGQCPYCMGMVTGQMAADAPAKTWQKGCPYCNHRLTVTATRSDTGDWILPVQMKGRR